MIPENAPPVPDVLHKKIGIFGGTFDPPHRGHLTLAELAQKQLGLHCVLWVLTGQSPFKQDRCLTQIRLRRKMLEATICGLPKQQISLVDAERPGPHYTADTLRIIAEQYPEADRNVRCELFYLLGSDSLRDFPDWHQPQEILRHCDLAVWQRPNVSIKPEFLEEQFPDIRQKLHWLDAPPQAVSSRDIRKRVRAEASGVKSLVSEALISEEVALLILQHRLYL